MRRNERVEDRRKIINGKVRVIKIKKERRNGGKHEKENRTFVREQRGGEKKERKTERKRRWKGK